MLKKLNILKYVAIICIITVLAFSAFELISFGHTCSDNHCVFCLLTSEHNRQLCSLTICAILMYILGENVHMSGFDGRFTMHLLSPILLKVKLLN